MIDLMSNVKASTVFGCFVLANYMIQLDRVVSENDPDWPRRTDKSKFVICCEPRNISSRVLIHSRRRKKFRQEFRSPISVKKKKRKYRTMPYHTVKCFLVSSHPEEHIKSYTCKFPIVPYTKKQNRKDDNKKGKQNEARQ